VVRPAVAIPNAPLDLPITDEVCLGHLDEGIYLRDRGDMVGAVMHLRKALELAPEHPKLLYQLASALDGMSQQRKAAPLWRQLRLLGQEAGNYYQLAVERLKEGGSLPAPDEAAADAEEQVKEGRFLVSHVTVQRLSDRLDAEVLRIEGQIDRRQAAAADVSLVDMKLHLFDEVNGQRIDRTTAIAPVIEWLDTPVDWTQGSERFRFEYRQPPLSPDELLKLGQRKYYGYAIEFRYDGNKLQDIAAEPSILADMARELPETVIAQPEGENFDPGAALAPAGQPDAVLFPGDKMDR
jgi:tetratricopeptide (TPR) repeat protein